MKKSEGAKLNLQVPPDIKAFLEERAKWNWTSMNAEAISAIRARMDAEQAKAVG